MYRTEGKKQAFLNNCWVDPKANDGEREGERRPTSGANATDKEGAMEPPCSAPTLPARTHTASIR